MSYPVKVIRLSEALDRVSGHHLYQEMSDCLQSGVKLILVDCQQLSFMNSAGLSALVMAVKDLREAQGRLYLCSVNDSINMILELSGLDTVLPIFPDQEAFEQAVLALRTVRMVEDYANLQAA